MPSEKNLLLFNPPIKGKHPAKDAIITYRRLIAGVHGRQM
jgi:hypothetical protein